MKKYLASFASVAATVVASPAFAQFTTTTVADNWVDFILGPVLLVVIAIGLVAVGIRAFYNRDLGQAVMEIGGVLIIGAFFAFIPQIVEMFASA